MSITTPKKIYLRTQLLRWLLYPLLALLAVDTAVSFGLASRFSMQAYDKALIDVANELSLQVTKDDKGIKLDLPEVARRLLLQDPQDKLFFELRDHSDQLIAGIALPANASSYQTLRGNAVVYDAQFDRELVRVVELFKLDSDQGMLRVAETYNKRREMTRDIIAIVILPQILLIFLVSILIRYGVTRGLLPLKALQFQIAKRTHRDRQPLNEDNVPGEVVPLVKSMNDLLKRLDTASESQSRFIADAAHQLKTPVAVLNSYVELLPRCKSQAERGEIVLQLSRAIGRMSRLVSQLLVLANSDDANDRPPNLVKIDLNELLFQISADWVPQAIKRGIDLGLDINKHVPVYVAGDPNLLQDLFGNLIDNAIRYSQPGGRVTINVIKLPTPVVCISDDARTITEEDKRVIFQRFHRLLGTGNGSGLGLAIAQNIASLHQASILIEMDQVDHIGNVFKVVFPTYPHEVDEVDL